MATLTWADSFDHQVASTTTYSSRTFYDVINRPAGISFDTTNKRTGTASMQIVEDGVAQTNVGKTVSTQDLVQSFYIRIATNPGAKSQFAHTFGATQNALVGVNTDGTVFANIGGGGEQTGAADITDGNWHRIDFRFQSSGTTYRLDVSVDGTALTQVTSAQAGGSTITSVRLGSNTNGHNLTFQVDDWVFGVTGADHPIGDHRVEFKVPTDDTADSVYGTNVMEQGTGTDLSSSNKAYQYLDEWPPTTGTNNADTVTQAATSGTSFVEVIHGGITLAGGESVMAVMARAAVQSDATTSNNGTTRVVDSANTTLIDLHSGDMSDTSPRYLAALVPAPGGTWDETEVDGLAFRLGFSSDAAPDPEWLACAFEVAIAEASVTVVTSDGATSRAKLYSTAAGRVEVHGAGTGRIKAYSRTISSVQVASAPASGWIRLRGTALGGSIVASSPASGWLRLRSTAVGVPIVISNGAVGRVKVFSTATGLDIVTGVASGHLNVRSSASGVVEVLGAASGWVKVWSYADGSPLAGLVLSDGGSGWVKLRANANGQAIVLGAAQGRLRVTSTASGLLVVSSAPATGRVRVYATASGVRVVLGTAASGRLHLWAEVGPASSFAAVVDDGIHNYGYDRRQPLRRVNLRKTARGRR